MKVIRNRTNRPLRISLAGGKVLHLGPGKTGQVSDDSITRKSFVKLVEAGDVEIVGDGAAEQYTSDSSTVPDESVHGHHPPTVVTPKGNR